MKKSLIFSILLLSLFCDAFAQPTSSKKNNSAEIQPKIEYGFLSGVNFNTIRQHKVNTFLKENLTNYAGLSIGGYFKLNINKQFGLKILAQYDQNGYRLEGLSFENSGGTGIASGIVTIKTTYLNFPIVGEFTFGNKIKYYINAGPYVGFLLSSNFITKISSTSNVAGSITKSKTDGYKSINIGASVGTGALIPISKKVALHFGLKNNFGLTSIIKTITTDDSKFNTNAFSVLAGVSFKM
jgi:hypothetical protein